MPRLMNTVRTLHVNVARYFVIYQAIEYREKSQTEHREMLEVCRQKNIGAACTFLEQHLQAAADNLIIFLEQKGQ